jgi:hypothetical protein
MLLIRRRRLVPFGVRRRLCLLPIEPHLTPSPSLHSGTHAWLPTPPKLDVGSIQPEVIFREMVNAFATHRLR